MTPEEIEQLVKAHGGKIVGQIPDFGKGAVAAAQHAAFYQERMGQLRAQQNPDSGGTPLSVTLKGATIKALEEIAELASTPESRRNAADVAVDILELAAIRRLEELRQLDRERRKTG